MGYAAIDGLIDRNRLSMKLRQVETNPILPGQENDGTVAHFLCRLLKPGSAMDVYLSLGAEEDRPTLADVLFLLAMDASGCSLLEGYQERIYDWGSVVRDEDESLKQIDDFWAEYKGRCEQTTQLKSFLGERDYRVLMQQFGVQEAMGGTA